MNDLEEEAIVEGGLGGHMPHLYENSNLTFAELKEVFSEASEGRLVGTEKTDGQNIKLSFSIEKQAAVGARNKTQMKAGGLTAAEMEQFFASHPNQNLKLAFRDAIAIFEKAVKPLKEEYQIQLFGSKSNIWYNAEVIDDRTRNVVNYDKRALVIHRTGHTVFYDDDQETADVQTESDIESKAKKLISFIEKLQDKISSPEHGLMVNPIQSLKALDNKEALISANQRLDRIIGRHKLDDSNTINDYLKAELNIKLQTSLPDDLKQRIINSVLEITPANKRDLKKGATPEVKAEIDTVIKNLVMLKKQAIRPIEIVVTDFAAEMLKSLESIFIIDNKAETARLTKEVEQVIKAISSSEKRGDLEFLKTQLSKLKGAETISSAVEGFAFSYKGIIYKFTGKFAPVNQILGLFKYGRNTNNDEEDNKESKQSDLPIYNTALLAGGFKPAHKGHLALLRELASKAERVLLFTSKKSSKQRAFQSGVLKGTIIDGEKCNYFLEKMVAAIPDLQNVRVIYSNTPLQKVFEYVQNAAAPNESILLGVGNKDKDADRFSKINNYAPPEKSLKIKVLPLTPVTFAGKILSATDLREAISNKEINVVSEYIPDEIGDKRDFATEMIQSFTGEQQLDEMSGMGAGAVAGYQAKRGKKMKIDRQAFMEEIKLRKLIRETLLLKQKNKKVEKLSEEQKLRKLIRQTITEAKKEFNYGNTGLNVLARLLVNIIPNLISTYESLQTSPEQRRSFRDHILSNIDDLLNRTEKQLQAGESAEQGLDEKMVVGFDSPEDDKFLDVFGSREKEREEKKKAETEPDFKVLSDADPTGVEFAQDAYKNVNKQVQEEFKKLKNEKDRKIFHDYLLSNLSSYIEQAEDKISRKADKVHIVVGQDNKEDDAGQVQEPVNTDTGSGMDTTGDGAEIQDTGEELQG